MEISTINLVYFSATNTTKNIVRTIGEQFEGKKMEYNLTQALPKKEIYFKEDELLILGVPVFSGRVPKHLLYALHQFRTSQAPAILVCVYGNRAYDDALLELKDIVSQHGFIAIGCGAFVAQHSIFPQVGASRPDSADLSKIKEFAQGCKELLREVSSVNLLTPAKVEGNKLYREAKKVPLYPKGNKHCNQCGSCVDQCPVGAISNDNPRETDKKKCISCARCITVCPEKARSFNGVVYKVANRKFINTYSERQEPTVVFANKVDTFS